MPIYAVRIFVQGIQQGTPLLVTARSAAEAMNEVEARLGLKPPTVGVEQETGRLMVSDWHGYEFRARQVH
jgi:hypothetical protein